MRIKFNLFERVAGLFVLTAIFGGVAVGISVAYKKGWFSSQVPLNAVFESADGIHVGTKVQMAGLRAGSVSRVELRSNNEVHVTFTVLERFFEKIRKDSVVKITRPFIIGEKVIEVSVGGENSQAVARNSSIPVESTMDIMDIISGRRLGPYMDTVTKMADALRQVVETLSEDGRFASVVKIFEEVRPLLENMNRMSEGVTQLTDHLNFDRRIPRLMHNLAVMTDELNRHMPKMAKEGPLMVAELNKTVHNLSLLTKEFKQVLPALKTVAPELPRSSERLLEAVDEAVITLKAMQKTFLMRGKVEEVLEEEAKKEANKENSSRNLSSE